MANIVKRLVVKILGDNKDLEKKLDKSKGSVDKFGQGIKKLGVALGAAFAVKKLAAFASESLKLYNTQAQAENQLLVALKGRKDAQQALIEQAKELQKTTLFGDEETIRAQALIAAFVKEESQIKKVIPLVQDLATAKGMDLAGAADLVSKTLGSSTNALSRYGIEVTGTVGSTERLESLTRGLAGAFEGQATAAAKAGSGGLTQLQNRFSDLKEVMGEWVNNIITDLLPSLNKLVDGLELVFKGAKKIREEAWDDATRRGVENEKKAVEDLALAYTAINPALTWQEAQLKSINAKLVELSGAAGMALDDKTFKLINDQISAIKEWREELTNPTSNAGSGESEDAKKAREASEAIKKEHDALRDLNHARFVEKQRIEESKKASSDAALQKYSQDIPAIEAEIDAMVASEDQATSTAETIDASAMIMSQAFEAVSQTVMQMGIDIANSFAVGIGNAAAGVKSFGEVLQDLGSMIISALGDILIMVGTAMTPIGIPLVLAGLAMKGIGAFVGSANFGGKNESPSINVPKGHTTNGSTLYGNDIRTSNAYATDVYNRVG